MKALKREPIFRALRCDKLRLVALQGTVDLHLREQSSQVPALQLLQISKDELRARAAVLFDRLRGLPLRMSVGRGSGKTGGGTLPRALIPSITVDIVPDFGTLEQFSQALRAHAPPDRLATSAVAHTSWICARFFLSRTISWSMRFAQHAPRARTDAEDVIVRHYVLATAGHIDHGKSALVKALTGTDPDRLPEEKSRGITIDLGFAELSLTATDGTTLHAGIVDVPGHEDFVPT